MIFELIRSLQTWEYSNFYGTEAPNELVMHIMHLILALAGWSTI